MLHVSRLTKILTAMAIGVFIFAACLRLVHFNGAFASGIPIVCLSATLYSGLIIAWAISVDYRITQKNIRNNLLAIAVIMVCWLILRDTKYYFIGGVDTACRYIWYAYYIAIVLLPVLLFFTALGIGKTSNRTLIRRWKLLFIPAIIIIAGVLTNDLHQTAFIFQPGFANWDKEYTYGVLYKIVVVWTVGLILASLAIIFFKCCISKIKKHIWVPIIFLIVCIFYLLWTCTEEFIYGEKLLQVPEAFCFTMIILCESCIQAGLIPSNIGYGAFLNASTLNASLTDNTGTLCYASENAMPLTQSQLEAAKLRPVMINNDARLFSHPVSGGRLYWVDDLSAINKMNAEIANNKKRLLKYNKLLKSETELKARTARAAEKNHLYDVMAIAVKPQLDRLANILEGAKADDPDLKRKYALASVYSAYIKRRCNLALIGESTEDMHLFELISSIRESVEYLKAYGIHCYFGFDEGGVLPTKSVILAYELFEMVVESTLPQLSSLLINLTISDGKLLLKLSMEAMDAVIDANWQSDRVKDCNGTMRVICEDHSMFITLCVGNDESGGKI